MKAVKKYVVYEFGKILGSENLSLVKVEFRGMVSNYFDTKKEAIAALKEDNRVFTDFVIMKQVYITNYK